MSNLPVSGSGGYHTPDERRIRSLTKMVMWVCVGGAALAAFLKVGPSVRNATILMNEIFVNGTHMLISGAIFIGVVLLIWQTFFKGGLIYNLIKGFYESICGQLTRMLVEYDPITPLENLKQERIQASRNYDEAFAQYDGVISNWMQKRDDYLRRAQKSKDDARAANEAVRAGDQSFLAAFQSSSSDYEEFTKAAGEYQSDIDTATPIRANIVQVQEANKIMIRSLERDTGIVRDRWDAAKQMAQMDKAGRAVLTDDQMNQLAAMSRDMIQHKYAEQIGRLNNLTQMTKPLTDAIKLQKLSASSKLLAEFEAESKQALLGAQAATGVQPVVTQQKVIAGSGFSGLLG